jgi:voltage-gated potassium channel
MSPDVFPHLTDGLFLVAATIAVHSAGTLVMLWALVRYRPAAEQHFNFLDNTALVTVVVIAVLCLHLAEVVIWAVFYQSRRCFPDFQTAAYFSLVSYSTVGYGNVELERAWRVLGGLEALTGTLMVSWSTALMLGSVTWIYKRRMDHWRVRPSGQTTAERPTPAGRGAIR